MLPRGAGDQCRALNIHQDVPSHRTHQDVQATAALASNDQQQGVHPSPDQGRRRIPAALQHLVNLQAGVIPGQTGGGRSQNRARVRRHSVGCVTGWFDVGSVVAVADVEHREFLAQAERFRRRPGHRFGRVGGPVGARNNTNPALVAGRGHDCHHAVADGGRLKTDRSETLPVPVRAPVGSDYDHVRIFGEATQG